MSHGILDEINQFLVNDERMTKNVVTDIIGTVLVYDREECLLIISPWLQCKEFDISKFDRPILSDPYKIILFLHGNGHLNLTASHCKLFLLCIRYGHIESIQYMLSNRVPINVLNDRASRDAARYGHLDILKLLHLNGGQIHSFHDECLRKAARYGHLDIVKYLVENDADIHVKNAQCLSKSIQHGHIQIADFLIKSGIKKEENEELTKIAIKYKQYDALSLLIKYGYTLYDEVLRVMALSALHGNDDSNNNSRENAEYEVENSENEISETESSASPPLSPQYLSYSSSASSNFDMNAFEADGDAEQRFLDAISEGLALREMMFVSVLNEFVLDEMAYIICSFEKLAYTEEDKARLENKNQSQNKRRR